MTLNGSKIDDGYFTMLGAHPQIGRVFQSNDLGKRNSIISDRAWRRYFNADPKVLARTTLLDLYRCRIVGVMSRAFRDISQKGLRAFDYWVPADSRGMVEKLRGLHELRCMGGAAARRERRRSSRRKPPHAQHRASLFARAWELESSDRHAGLDLIVGPVRQRISFIVTCE